jgi:hypothetical protein
MQTGSSWHTLLLLLPSRRCLPWPFLVTKSDSPKLDFETRRSIRDKKYDFLPRHLRLIKAIKPTFDGYPAAITSPISNPQDPLCLKWPSANPREYCLASELLQLVCLPQFFLREENLRIVIHFGQFPSTSCSGDRPQPRLSIGSSISALRKTSSPQLC